MDRKGFKIAGFPLQQNILPLIADSCPQNALTEKLRNRWYSDYQGFIFHYKYQRTPTSVRMVRNTCFYCLRVSLGYTHILWNLSWKHTVQWWITLPDERNTGTRQSHQGSAEQDLQADLGQLHTWSDWYRGELQACPRL